MAYKRKQLLIDETEFKALKKIFCGGIYYRASDSLFVRDVISTLLEKENHK